MCGISAVVGEGWQRVQLESMIAIQRHRGPDDEGLFLSQDGRIGLGHNRLSIIDTSKDANQPMSNWDESVFIVFNGELYNYLELRAQLKDYPYRTKSDTEVILAAYQKWGQDCLKHFIGMFSFILWDKREDRLFVARDRFGVKPLYYASCNDYLLFSSEIKALFAAGIPRKPDSTTWATYLNYGLYEHSEKTFWEGVSSLPAGCAMTYQHGKHFLWQWYDLKQSISDKQEKLTLTVVKDQYLSLLEETIKLRFRSDVPVGINLSGGLDSSILLGLVDRLYGSDNEICVFTFATGDANYDELPWVQKMLSNSKHPHQVCVLRPEEVPNLAQRIQSQEDEPYGGIPTIAYSKTFERAGEMGIKVLLDGQGLDEQWAGYDYYSNALVNKIVGANGSKVVTGPVQGSSSPSVQPDSLIKEFKDLAVPMEIQDVFADNLKNLQYRDTKFAKIPRALRFNDRISMMFSTELREPFLDHRLFELAFGQSQERKIKNGVHKWLLREIAADIIPKGVSHAPKRPLQTPQREWLRGPLANWVKEHLNHVSEVYGGTWFHVDQINDKWESFRTGHSDNSFYIWQWISLSIMSNQQ